MRTRRFSGPVLLVLAALAGCTPEAPPEGVSGDTPAVAGATGNPQGRVFQRALVFVTSVADSTLLVPWIFTTRTRPGGVDRNASAWLERGGTWEPFLRESWESPPTRAPWRLQPHGRLRLVVGGGEALETLAFEEGPRHLEVEMGTTRAEWSSSPEETFVVTEGAAVLSDRRLPGLVLDFNRTYRGEGPPPGEWMFLTSGDSVQIVFQSTAGATADGAGAFRGWAKLQDFRELSWPDVTTTWTERRAFERARREVPVRWTLSARADDMSAELEVRAAHIEAGAGEGPQLPVEALFEVGGSLRIGETEYPLRGLVRHVQR